ncbi:MAG: hypothetical protein U0168_06190 [Nannocystaceae bacterium]
MARTLVALVLVGVAWLPLEHDGDVSLVRVLLEAWREDWLQGLLVTLVVGAPHLFGLAVLYGSRRPGAWASAAVRAWNSWLMFEARSCSRWWSCAAPAAAMPRARRGCWSASSPCSRVCTSTASPAGTCRRIAATWASSRAGALAIFGVFAWGDLQFHGGAGPGLWYHATSAAAFALAAVVPRDR